MCLLIRFVAPRSLGLSGMYNMGGPLGILAEAEVTLGRITTLL
jgi:hypothetical protein